MKALVLCQVLDRRVNEDRTVEYSISLFGRHILDLSKPLLAKIREQFKDKDSALLVSLQKKG